MRYMIFDLDNTLYPKEIGLFRLVDQRINDYMMTRVGVDQGLVEGLRIEYMNKYGTTLGGLIVHHNVDPDDYLSYVHDIEMEGFLSTNLALSALLEKIALEKVIFTNGSSDHATKVLNTLGITDCFSRVFDIKFLDYLAKPDPRSYEKILKCLDAEGSECVIIEDLERNIVPAKKLGMTTVLVGEKDSLYADFIIEDILGIEKVFTEMGIGF